MGLLAGHVEIISLDWLRSHGLIIAVIIAVALGVSKLAKMAIRRMQRRIEGAESVTQEMNLVRATTLTHAMSYAIRVVIWSLAILLVLDQVGVNLAPLLAGAGIAGVALGFGAQSLVKDVLAGFFFLLENQFGVGDIVAANVGGQEVAGKVEELNLRTTSIRAFDGTLNVVPNGNMILVGNRTRGWARAIVDVGVAYGEDVQRVKEVLEELFREIGQDEQLARRISDGPTVLGVETLGEYEVVVRVTADVRPPYQWEVARELRKRIKDRFDRAGIEIPFPYRVMISRGEEGPDGGRKRGGKRGG